jgi:micrococcal nuclease
MNQESLHKDLMECSMKNTPYFSLCDQEFTCKCVKVYDGDTITVIFKPFEQTSFYKFRIRLYGIDTPELRTKNKEEKKKGIIVRDFLRELVLDKIITIKCSDFDKYGRLLADIYIKDMVDKSINTLLIEKGYAYSYDGGMKQKF